MKIHKDNSAKTFKVLVVDDDIKMVKTIERLLYNKNYIVYSALSGKDALTKLKETNPDIMLLDILMPEMDGYELCDKIKNNPSFSTLPIIFLTEANDTEMIIKAFEHGAVDYVTKPFNSRILFARIDTHLQLQKSREELKNTNEVKTKFFSIITKDIKDNLLGMKGMADFLVQDLSEVEGKNTEGIKMAKILQEDSKQLYELLENLIEWATVETEQTKINTIEFSICEFITETINLYRDNLSKKRLNLLFNCPQEIKLCSDPNAMQIIFSKILSNAIKYSHPENSIEINVEKKNSDCVFSVTDYGVGMDEEVVKSIFRLDTPHPKTIGTAEEKGTGLGLVICNSLVEKLHGNINISSKKFRGTIVTVSLPDIN